MVPLLILNSCWHLHLVGVGFVLACSTLALLAAAKDGPGWKKIFNRRGRTKEGTAVSTDPAIRSRDWQRSAKIFEKEGRYREAAGIFQEKGQNYEAARLMMRAGALTEAASLLERIGHHLKAAEVCDKAGDSRRAGENYRRYLEERFGSLATARSPVDHADFTHYCRLAGQAFERAGLHEQAAEVLERGEHWEEAADLYIKLARYVKAADLYQCCGAMNRAADAYAQAGDRVRAAQMRGEYLYKEDQKNEAAVQFLLGGDPLRAAEVYEEAGNYLDSARCFEHCGAHRRAAEAYQHINELGRAAEMFGRCQDYETAATLYEDNGDLSQAVGMYREAGLIYKAAMVAKKADLNEEAIACLQKIKPDSEDYRRAQVELANHFMERSMPGVAVEKLRKAIGKQSVSLGNLAVYYSLADAVEQLGDYKKAVDILKKIVAEDYNFRDAVGKLQELEKRVAEMTASESASSAIKSELVDRDRYELKEKLGAGGMGVVYQAYDHLLKRVVAYKMLMEQYMDMEDIRERFLREARSAAILNHPNIVTIFDVGVDRGRLFISMEYVEGVSYYQVLEREVRLHVPAVMHCIGGVVRALAHAHSKGVVHRDIKPSNIMLSTEQIVKIADFGLAKILGKAKEEGSGRASGTPLYMSPEQILGDTLDFRADIYALGATLFHLLAGEPPFVEGEVLFHHVNTEPRRLRELRPDVPDVLEAVVMRCLKKDPDARFQKTEDIISALRST